jgi:hypothetical protein
MAYLVFIAKESSQPFSATTEREHFGQGRQIRQSWPERLKIFFSMCQEFNSPLQ